ncbi:Uncharacterized conserved protein, DUF305 family [Micromonospora purpureochromogenes]|uniref:Uncharacterized conserved protein, DUF305 family n=1 Tax=Micromonospora purpureochromogenes TaxID=47872 RepID=A0A1C4ZX90_9ACTN|nr:Uncharacterized conserved protein, DUF305 family [Micromonospora purpureochromogenes]
MPVRAASAPRRDPARRGAARALLLVVLAALLPAAGCADAPTPQATRPATAGPTDTALGTLDVVYLTMMVAHTEQTMEIVRLGRDRVTDPELRTLVAAIEVTEADELTTMRAWLRDAGPGATAQPHDHTGHGAGPADLARLRNAPAGQVDAVLRRLLGSHQQAAADLARAHVATATNPRVRELARRVEQSRTAEVRLLTAPAAGRR